MAEKIDHEPSYAMIPFGFEAMTQMQWPAFTAIADLNGKLYESIAAVNKEWGCNDIRLGLSQAGLVSTTALGRDATQRFVAVA